MILSVIPFTFLFFRSLDKPTKRQSFACDDLLLDDDHIDVEDDGEQLDDLLLNIDSLLE